MKTSSLHSFGKSKERAYEGCNPVGGAPDALVPVIASGHDRVPDRRIERGIRRENEIIATGAGYCVVSTLSHKPGIQSLADRQARAQMIHYRPRAANRVSAYKIPYVHGLTIGELAQVYNEEGLLKDSVKCDLTVVPMEGWERSMSFEETGLSWVPSSPHVPEGSTPPYYVATGILGELYVMNIGIGYTTPFKTYAAEWMDANELAEEMNKLGLEGVIFRPVYYKPFYGADEGKNVQGVQVHITDFRKTELMYLQFRFMEVHHKLYPEQDLFEKAPHRWRMFDIVCGTDEVRKTFMENYRFADIKPIFERDVEAFREMSEKYYLYK